MNLTQLFFYFAIDTPRVDPKKLKGIPNTGGTGDPGPGAISTILSVTFAITASIALLMIVIAGFKYVLSRGDPNAVAQAKDTIINAVIGLLISLAAFSIVTFVVNGIG